MRTWLLLLNAWQVHIRVWKSVLSWREISATTLSKFTCRPSSLSPYRGCLSGSTRSRVRRASQSACWPCWRRPRRVTALERLCRGCPTSKRSTSGWSSVSRLSLRLSSSMPSSTCWHADQLALLRGPTTPMSKLYRPQHRFLLIDILLFGPGRRVPKSYSRCSSCSDCCQFSKNP